MADVEQRKTNEMIGAELGYRYVGSPVITDEPGGPEQLFRTYVPTTWPGARLPHVWIGADQSIHDLISDGYTLLNLSGAPLADDASLAAAMAAIGAPFTTLAIDSTAARDVYGRDFVLVRPDLHIVWRGNRLPDNPAALASLITGHHRLS